MCRDDSREFIQTHSFGQSAQSAPFYLDRTLTSDIPGPSNWSLRLRFMSLIIYKQMLGGSRLVNLADDTKNTYIIQDIDFRYENHPFLRVTVSTGQWPWQLATVTVKLENTTSTKNTFKPEPGLSAGGDSTILGSFGPGPAKSPGCVGFNLKTTTVTRPAWFTQTARASGNSGLKL